MALDLDTFLVALYTVVDDLYREHFAEARSRRPGRRPELSDSEVLTLLICGQFFGRSERWMVRHAARSWKSYFPRLLSQSATNRRGRYLCFVLIRLVPLVASRLEQELPSAYQALDSLPVPLMRQARGRAHRLFADEADVGVGGADKSFYYGCQLLLSVGSQGAVKGFVLGSASTNVRWLADCLLAWRRNPRLDPWTAEDLPDINRRRNGGMTGPKGPIWPQDAVGAWTRGPYIADSGFSGACWLPHWEADYQARVLTPESYGPGSTWERAE